MKTLEQVRMYSVLVSDPRVRELISWYLRALQRAVDIIWESIEWRYVFPRVERRGGKLRVAVPYKVKVPELPRSSAFKKKLRDEFTEGLPLCEALGRRRYKDGLLGYGILEEEVHQGKSEEG